VETFDWSTHFVHLVARATLRWLSPLRAKSITDRIAALVPPLREPSDAQTAMQGLSGSGTCLTRALAVASRLAEAEVVIGLHPASKPFRTAHAWVESNGTRIETVDALSAEGGMQVTEIVRLPATKHRKKRSSAIVFEVSLRESTELLGGPDEKVTRDSLCGHDWRGMRGGL
jgi:hypothetical protein